MLRLMARVELRSLPLPWSRECEVGVPHLESSTRLLPTKGFIQEGDSPSCIAHLCGRTHPRCPVHEPTLSLPNPNSPGPRLGREKDSSQGFHPTLWPSPGRAVGQVQVGLGKLSGGRVQALLP